MPKGVDLSLRFVGGNPTKAKSKIQGFTPTDKLPALHLLSTRGENMEKITSVVWAALFLRFGSSCVHQSDSVVGLGRTQQESARNRAPPR